MYHERGWIDCRSGQYGVVHMDANADKSPVYDVWQYTPGDQQCLPYARIDMRRQGEQVR